MKKILQDQVDSSSLYLHNPLIIMHTGWESTEKKPFPCEWVRRIVSAYSHNSEFTFCGSGIELGWI